MRPKTPYWLSLGLGLILFTQVCSAGSLSSDSAKLNKRQKWVYTTLGTSYVGGFTGLYYLWYADYNEGHFHFFNDLDEWGQMDKCGHTFSAYAETKYVTELMKWSGYSDHKAAWLGAGYSFLFQTTIEVLDGFSSGWGFSVSDLGANFTGTGGYLLQEVYWKDQRIKLKYSYRNTQYPQYRPNLLGSSFSERMFKDYNGQTYWASFNLSSFFPDAEFIPDWLNIAVGYSIDGFVGARDNCLDNLSPCTRANFPRMRQFYLSPDIDLEKIHVRNKALKLTLSLVNNLKFPLPAVGYSQNGKFEFLALGF